MITKKQYKQLKKLPKLTPSQASQVETYEFLALAPEKALVYVNRPEVSPGVVGKDVTIVTDWGQKIGVGRIGNFFRNGPLFGYKLVFKSLTGVKYKGLYYASSGYARVNKVKGQ